MAVEDNTVGVPLMAAVLTSNNNPVGSTGPIVNVSCPSPPAAVTGVKDATATPTVSVTDAVVAVVTIAVGRFTVSSKVLLLVFAALSVAVIVKVERLNVSLGIPEICPVETLNVRPAGSAGVIAKVVDPLPPDDVTGMNDVISFP